MQEVHVVLMHLCSCRLSKLMLLTVGSAHTGAGLWWDVKKEDRGAFADKQGIPKELYDFVTPFMQDSAIAAPQATVQSGAPAAAAAHTDNEDKDGGGPQGDAGVLVGSTSSTVGATEVADCVQLYMGEVSNQRAWYFCRGLLNTFC